MTTNTIAKKGLGKTYFQCLEAGCKQITRQEDL